LCAHIVCADPSKGILDQEPGAVNQQTDLVMRKAGSEFDAGLWRRKVDPALDPHT
jgi:hypothetical protein